jgi:aryl carrier-like protein
MTECSTCRDVHAIACIIREKTLAVLSRSNLDDSEGFFDAGMDSLQALQLTRALQRALKRPNISLSMIYENSTVLELATAITQQAEKQVDDKHIMGPLLATYRELIEQIPGSKSPTSQPGMDKGETIDVILTGPTGTLGTHLLHTLLRRGGIGHIFCLNWAADGGLAAQDTAFKFNHLDTGSFKARVSFLSVNLAHPSLGVEKATYDMLCHRARVIVHNAWPVDFHLGLSAFRPQLVGLINLFALAVAGISPMRILFIHP